MELHREETCYKTPVLRITLSLSLTHSLFLTELLLSLQCRDDAQVSKEMEKKLKAKLFHKVQQQLLQLENEINKKSKILDRINLTFSLPFLTKGEQTSREEMKEFEEWKT